MSHHLENFQDLPSSVLQYYIKLYTTKMQHSPRHKKLIVEATRSWTMLTVEEKNLVKRKYEEYINTQRLRYAKYLKNMEPYLKKKHRFDTANTIISNSIQEQSHSNESDNILFNKMSNHQNEKIIQGDHNVDALSMFYKETNMEDSNEVNFVEPNNTRDSGSPQFEKFSILSEPKPPLFKTAKQFFTMIQDLDDNFISISWESLSVTQKRRFQSALSKLKRQYIEDYTKYLRNIPSIELYKLLNEDI